MNWEAIGAVGEVGGAFAVVVTLVYLAKQIRFGAESNMASTQIAIEVEFNRYHEWMTSNRELLETLEKSTTTQALDPIQRRQFLHHANRLLNQWLAVQLAYDHGSIDEAYFQTMKQDVRRVSGMYPGIDERLREILASYSAKWEIFESLYNPETRANA